jgi:hypothetical protein
MTGAPAGARERAVSDGLFKVARPAAGATALMISPGIVTSPGQWLELLGLSYLLCATGVELAGKLGWNRPGTPGAVWLCEDHAAAVVSVRGGIASNGGWLVTPVLPQNSAWIAVNGPAVNPLVSAIISSLAIAS